MNQLHPIFQQIVDAQFPGLTRGTPSDARHDLSVLRSMETILRDKLTDAVAACYAEARDLKALDADEVMESVNKYFNPTGAYQQDNFVEGFHGFKSKLEG